MKNKHIKKTSIPNFCITSIQQVIDIKIQLIQRIKNKKTLKNKGVINSVIQSCIRT